MESEEQRLKVRRYVATSFILHILLFLSFAVGSFFSPKPLLYEPTIHVDMVALPTQVKNNDQPPPDVSLPVKPNPPPPPPEETKEDERMVKPEPKPAPKDPAEDMALERKKEAEAKKRAEDALKKMREKLQKERLAEEQKKRDKRKQDLADFEKKYRQAIAGNQKNEGTALTGQMQATLNAYVGAVTDKIRSNWALPSFLQGEGHKASIVIHIDGRGNIVKMEFTRTSGNEVFDNNAEAAIRRSNHFPPPPAEMASQLRNGGIEVRFPL